MDFIIKVIFISLFVTLATGAKLTQPKNNLNVEYTVQNGDSLYLIAHEHHTTVSELLKANNLNWNAVIKVGQVLKVPVDTYFPNKKSDKTVNMKPKVVSNTKSSNESVEYTIQSGDTLFTIARAHHTSIRAILEKNNMDMKAVIKVGRSLTVPLNNYTPTIGEKSDRRSPPPIEQKKLFDDDSVVSQTSTNRSNGKDYIVKSGDTLFSIARKNHIVISKLMKLNNIGLGNKLRIGQVLKVVEGGAYIATTQASKPKDNLEKKKRVLPAGAMPSYTVKKGDTLWKIARKHHLTLAQIRKLNKMRKKDRIHTGMLLAVGKAAKPSPKTYKVRRGDTVWLVAKKNNMSAKKLRKLNHMKRKDRIHTGMILALTKNVETPRLRKLKKEKEIIAKLKKKGAKRSEIKAVLAKVKRSKKRNPNIYKLLAQVKKSKTKREIETPLRISKAKRGKKDRLSSATSMLNGRKSSSSRGWSRGGSKVIRTAKRYLGRRYVWGAVGPRSFDCSGFTQYVMRKSKGVTIPRVSRRQAYYGKYVSRSHLRSGDLVFFDTSRRRRGYVNHVGIYIGNNKFIHASSARHRVVITSLNRPFYRARFKWGRRVN